MTADIAGTMSRARSFDFHHGLHADPLFSLEGLRRLAERHLQFPHLLYWSNGSVDVHHPWRQGTQTQVSLDATLANIGSNHSLVVLKSVELDVEMGPAIRQIVGSLMDLAGPEFADDVEHWRGTILVASPERITPYHIDADTSFLFQIASRKVLTVYNGRDRNLLTELQLERYFMGNISAAEYPSEAPADTVEYALAPGSGVHLPSMAPHWARNMDGISIALSVNFDLRSVRRLGTLYRVNHRLRRLGFSPARPELETWRNVVKLSVAEGLRMPARLLAALPGRTAAVAGIKRHCRSLLMKLHATKRPTGNGGVPGNL